jgi:hypothetical protein
MNGKWKIEWIQIRIPLKAKDYNVMHNDDDGDDDDNDDNDAEDQCLGLQSLLGKRL